MRSAGIAVSFVMAAGCSFDLSQYEPSGAGGAGTGAKQPASTSSGSPSGPGSTTSQTATATSGSLTPTATGSGSTTVSSSTGMSTVLPPCGGFTDNFNQFPTNPMWNVAGASKTNGHAQAKFIAGFAGAWRNGASYDECYASVSILDLSGGSAYLNLWQSVTTSIILTTDGSKVTSPSTSVPVTDLPKALAIAFHNQQVYYLYIKHGGSGWEPAFDVQPRASWMDQAVNTLGFGINSANFNDTATFADFNVLTVTTGDL